MNVLHNNYNYPDRVVLERSIYKNEGLKRRSSSQGAINTKARVKRFRHTCTSRMARHGVKLGGFVMLGGMTGGVGWLGSRKDWTWNTRERIKTVQNQKNR